MSAVWCSAADTTLNIYVYIYIYIKNRFTSLRILYLNVYQTMFILLLTKPTSNMTAYHVGGQQGSSSESFQVNQHVTQELQNELQNDQYLN